MEELIAKYLADELGEKERADFESQLIQDESFSLEFEAYLNAWALQDEPQSGRFDTKAAWSTVQKQITATPVVEMKKSNFSFLKVAATLLVLAVAGFFVIKGWGVTEPDAPALSVFTTPVNATQSFELLDGTAVKLNANSKISYDEEFGKSHRNVTLSGQADFDVVRNENRPFIIKAGKGQIEVLGTNFDVAAYPGKSVKVAVTEGTVAFASTVDQAQKAVLTQGQQAEMDEEGKKLEVSEIKNQNYKGWWTRKLDFDNDAFEEIFSTLEGTYQVEIEYPDAMKDCRWTHQTGPDESVETLLDFLKQSFSNLQYTVKENQIILEGTACAD